MAERIEAELEVIPVETSRAMSGLQSIFSKSLSAAMTGLRGATNITGGIASGSMGGLLGGAGAALGLLGPQAAIAGQVLSGVGQLLDNITRLSRVANPAVVEQFTLAMEDFQGVVGRFVTPIVEEMTKGMRLLGDVTATVLPPASELRNVMAGFDPVLKEFRSVMETIGPLLRDQLVVFLRVTAFGIREFSASLATLLKVIDNSPFLRILAKTAGESGLKSSFGAAARGASFVGSEDIGRSLILGALQRGTAEESARRTADATERTAAATETIAQRMWRNGGGFTGIGFSSDSSLTR